MRNNLVTGAEQDISPRGEELTAPCWTAPALGQMLSLGDCSLWGLSKLLLSELSVAWNWQNRRTLMSFLSLWRYHVVAFRFGSHQMPSQASKHPPNELSVPRCYSPGKTPPPSLPSPSPSLTTSSPRSVCSRPRLRRERAQDIEDHDPYSPMRWYHGIFLSPTELLCESFEYHTDRRGICHEKCSGIIKDQFKKPCQRHNGLEGWVHITISTQILIKLQLQSLN